MDTPSPPKTKANDLQDTLKLVVIGGTVETVRRTSASAWSSFVDSFFQTAKFEENDQPYDWLNHWLAKVRGFETPEQTGESGQSSGGSGSDDIQKRLALDAINEYSKDTRASGDTNDSPESFLGNILRGTRTVSRCGQTVTMCESKPKNISRNFRRQKTTIVINAQHNCGNTIMNSNNDSSRVDVSSGNTFNTNNGDGDFTNAMSPSPEANYESELNQEIPPPDTLPPPPDQGTPYYMQWIVHVWSWVPCFSWDGWFPRFSGWMAQLTPQICSQPVWP